MRHGKDVIADKPGCVSLEQLEQVKNAVAESGRFWSVTFSERFAVRCVTRAGELVRAGRIGRVVQTLGLGPHREGDRDHLAGGGGRPDWFYDSDRFGGIITDIASHQIDQFLWFTGSTTAGVVASTVANYTHPDSPKMQDFGELLLRSESAQGYIRVDWYTPQGLPTWGDGRLLLLGTEGYIEMRKYVDLEGRPGGDHLFLVDQEGTHYVDCSDVQLTYYSDLVRDVRERTTTACPQEHTFEVMRLALEARHVPDPPVGARGARGRQPDTWRPRSVRGGRDLVQGRADCGRPCRRGRCRDLREPGRRLGGGGRHRPDLLHPGVCVRPGGGVARTQRSPPALRHDLAVRRQCEATDAGGRQLTAVR
jgi:predicted dehydrogenase